MKELVASPPHVAMGQPVQQPLTGRVVRSDGFNPLVTVSVTRCELERMMREMETSATESITVPCFLQGIVEGRTAMLRPT